MQIEVAGDRAISQQARTYAEYRVFAALTPLGDADGIRQVRVRLREVRPGRGCPGVACTVTIALQGSDAIRIRTIGPHAYAAINSAVDRLRANRPAATADQLSV